jgi:integrase
MKRGKPAFIIREGSVIVRAYHYKASARYCLYYRKRSGAAASRETKTGETAARIRAREIAIALANGCAEVLELTNADRDSYLHAKSILPVGVPLHSAIEEWKSARNILGDISIVEAANIVVRSARTARAIPSSAQILDEMLAELKDHQRSDRHIRALRKDLELCVARFPRLETTCAADLMNFLREKIHIGPRRRDNIRDAIVQLSRFARRHNYLAEDRISEAEKVGKIKPGHDVSTWTSHEAAIILEHTARRWLPWMSIGMFAGLRPSEILRLDWSAIKFDQCVIAVSRRVARKVRISRLVPIQENLLYWLQPFRDLIGPIYPGNFKTNENAKSAEIKRIRIATGIKWRSDANRHSFGSYRLSIVKSFEQVSVEMGNSPRKVREDYNDPKPEAEGIAYFELMPPSRISNIVAMPLPLEFR